MLRKGLLNKRTWVWYSEDLGSSSGSLTSLGQPLSEPHFHQLLHERLGLNYFCVDTGIFFPAKVPFSRGPAPLRLHHLCGYNGTILLITKFIKSNPVHEPVLTGPGIGTPKLGQCEFFFFPQGISELKPKVNISLLLVAETEYTNLQLVAGHILPIWSES